VLLNDARKTVRDLIERLIPARAHQRAAIAHHWMQQPRLKSKRLAERGALGAQPPEIRRMIGIAGDYCAASAVGLGEHTAADAAVWTRRAHSRRMLRERVHQ